MRVFLLLLLALAAASNPTLGQRLDPESVVERLVTASHGLTWASGAEVQTLLDQVRADPTPYLPHLLDEIRVGMIAAEDDPSVILRAENAVTVIVDAGDDIAKEQLLARLASMYSASDQVDLQLGESQAVNAAAKQQLVRQRRSLNRLLRLENHVLRSFGDRGDTRIQGLVLDRLEKRGPEDVQSIYYYLKRTGIDDQNIRQRLQELVKRPESRVFESAELQNLLEQN